MSKYLLLFFVAISLFFAACQEEQAPKYEGLWQIFMVKVENNQQNPVAFWLEIEGERFRWGDGDFVVDSGKWVLDEAEVIALLNSDSGTEEDTEWALSFRNDTLVMKGTENKSSSHNRYMEAVRIQQRPIHFRDQVLGQWRFEEVQVDSVPQPKIENAFIEFNENGKWYAEADSGVWIMNPYAPVLKVNSITGQPLNEWLAIFTGDTMRWIGTSTLQQDKVHVILTKK